MKTLRLLCGLLACTACEDADPAMAVLDNGYLPSPEPAQQTAVYKAWWVVAEFPDPVAAGASSEPQRVIPESSYAYAVLAPGWDPGSLQPPTVLLPVRTRMELRAHRGRMLHVVIGPDSTLGDCRTGAQLTQADADFITQRIFPREFAGQRYDATRCVGTELVAASDAGVL